MSNEDKKQKSTDVAQNQFQLQAGGEEEQVESSSDSAWDLEEAHLEMLEEECKRFGDDCKVQSLISKFEAASTINEKIHLLLEHRARTNLMQLGRERAICTLDDIAEHDESPVEDIIQLRLRLLCDLLDFEAEQCKLEVTLAALRVMKKGEIPFYKEQSVGECPFCLDEMFENVTTMRFMSKPVAVHYSCCDNSLCYSCCKELNRKVIEEGQEAHLERLLLGTRALGLTNKHFAKIERMLKCPFCRAPVTISEIKRTEEHRRCADRGDTRAQCEYGRRLMKGIGVKANRRRGIKLLVDTARRGSTTAKIYLASESLGGWEPGRILPSKAKEYAKDISGAGHPEGQFLLASEVISMSEVDEIPTEAYDLLVLAAWQLSASAASLICSCFVQNCLKKEGDIIDEAHIDAKLLFWAGRQAKYCSPFPGYHDALQNFGNGLVETYASTLPRVLYWARRELLEANQSRDDPNLLLQCHVALDAKTLKTRIHQMEHLISSRCANCYQMPSKKIHLNFCNR